jgi:hypothetical protein
VSSRPPESRTAAAWRRYGDSIWVVVPALVFGFFTWLSFFILGIRGRRRDWMMTGAAYAVYSSLVFFALGRPEVDVDDTAGTLMGFAILVAWIGGTIQALFANREFQRGREGLALPGPGRLRRGARRPAAPPPPPTDDLGLGLGNPAADYLAASQPPGGTGGAPPTAAAEAAWGSDPPPGSPPPEAPVEANTASPRTLGRLPGVTPELARRWVSERRRRGGFRDIDDLAVALDLQPHEIVRLRPRLSFTAPVAGPRRPRFGGRGRVLDV